jgi:hypothetical protein
MISELRATGEGWRRLSGEDQSLEIVEWLTL